MTRLLAPRWWLALLCAVVSLAVFAAWKPEVFARIWPSAPESNLIPEVVVAKADEKPLPIRETRVQSTNGSTLTVVPVSGTGPGERCTVASYNAQGEPTLVAPSDDDLCKVQVNWTVAAADRVAGMGLIEYRNQRRFDRTIDDRGRTGNVVLADSGQITRMLSPAGRGASSFAKFSLGSKSLGGSNLLAANVVVKDHPDAAINFDIAADSCLALDGLGAGYSDFLASVDPGRWTGFIARNPGSPGANYDVVRRLPGTSYDFEFRTLTQGGLPPVQQIRATWYTYDGNFKPVWLQTEWLDLSGYDGLNRGSQFKGELRRYRWNSSAAGRTGGKRVGKITGVLLKPEYPAYGAGIRIMVNREWDEPGVTDALPGGKLLDGECLLRHNSFFDYGHNTQVNDAFSGVWSLANDAPNSEADSLVISGGTETHLLRMWDTAGNPIWTFAMNSAPAPSIFVPSALTLPVRYARSPYTRGFPINLGPDHFYVPECKLNACEMCSIPVGTLMRSYNTPIDGNANEPFNMAQLQINLSVAANQPAPEAYGSQCGLHNSQAPLGMGNPAINWVRPRNEDLDNFDWIGAGRSRFLLDDDAHGYTGRVRASPQVVGKATYTSETSFRVSWAVPELPAGSNETYRLVRRRYVASDFKIVSPLIAANGSMEDGIYQREAPGIDEIRSFPPSSYIYEVRKVTPTDQVGVVVAKGAQVYVRDPRDPPLPPDCFKILEGTLTDNASATCAPGYGPNLDVQSEADLVLLFSNSFSAQYYFITEEKLVNGQMVPANCNAPGLLGAGASGESQPPNYRRQIKACEAEGSYYYQIYACDHDYRCSPRRPITPIIVNVNSVPAPQNVTAVRQELPNDGGYGFKVNWTHPITTPPSGTTLDFQVRYRKPSSTSYIESAVITAREHSGIIATPRTSGLYEFSVRARTVRTVDNVQTIKFSEWSQPASLQLPPNVAVAGEIADDPRGAAYNPSQHDYRSPQAESAILAGATASEAGVVGGAASYSLPIQLPPGRHGMQPSVSLNYSSRAGNGLAGMGFSVSASASISRCPQTLATDGQVRAVQFNADDRLCLDGQRLIRTGGSTYGMTGAEYRTELDSYTLVRQRMGSDNDTYFEVLSKSGERMYFGADQAGQNSRNSRVKPVGTPSTATMGGSLSWLLNTRLDRSENNIQYTYATFGSGENLLSKIAYTGAGVDEGTRKVEFVYVTRPDLSSSYLAGALSQQTQRLSSIKAFAPDSSSVQLVRHYKLSYVRSGSSARSLLSSVEECAGNGTCFKPNLFNWDHLAAGFDSAPLDQLGWQALPRPEQTPLDYVLAISEIVQLGDLDGDGDRELRVAGTWVKPVVGPPGIRVGYLLSQSADRKIESAKLLPFDHPLMLFRADEFADVNNDGRADIVTTDSVTGNLVAYYYNAGIGVAGLLASDFSAERLQKVELNIPTPIQRRRNSNNVISDVPSSALMVDVNSDGWDDIAGSYASSNCPSTANGNTGVAFGWYANTRATNGVSFNSTREDLFCLTPINAHTLHAIVARSIDLDGNGSPDFLISNPTAPANFTYLTSAPTVFGGAYMLYGNTAGLSTVFRDAATLGVVDTGLEEKTFVRNWIDVNADGLSDIVYPNITPNNTWFVQINRGGSFTQAFNTQSRLTLENRLVGEAGGGYRDAPLGQFGDYDSDGKADFLAPHSFEAMACYSRAIDEPVCTLDPRRSNASCEAQYFCPATPSMPFTLSGSPNEAGNAKFPQSFWAGSSSPATSTLQIIDHSLNPSIYKMQVHTFQLSYDSNGAISAIALEAQPLPEKPILFSPGSVVSNEDLHADGLVDALSGFGCGSPGLAPSPNEPSCQATELGMISTDGRADPMLLAYDNVIAFSTQPMTPVHAAAAFPPRLMLSRNKGAEDRGELPPKATDMLASTEDAFGLQAQFDYFPLASHAARLSTDLPLYRIPARNGSSGQGSQGYIDANHFYFTSSMNVVAEIKQRNGIGGLNTTRYGYEEAMYNNKGRGFTGFRKIIVEDLTQGLRTATVYHQKFPRVSDVQCSASNRLIDPITELFDSTSEASCTSSKAISFSVATQECNGGDCVPILGPIIAPVQVLPKTSTSTTRDLLREQRTHRVSEVESTISYSAYGNPAIVTTTTTDFREVGGVERLVRVHSSRRENSYALADVPNWWVNKLLATRVRLNQSYGTGHDYGVTGTEERGTRTLYGYDAQRNVTCEKHFRQSDSPTNCESTSVAPERWIERSYDGFGNLSGEITRARLLEEERTTSSDFGASGYFPGTVTDAFGKFVTTEFDPRFGVPLKITDANGLNTTNQLDGMGRVVRVTPPSKEGLSAGYASTTAYERCGHAGVSCLAPAVVRVVSAQYGGARTAVYLDSLGRTIRTASAMLAQPLDVSGFSDTNKSVSTTRYNARGLVQFAYEPQVGMENMAASTQYVYDDLGRPIWKVQQFNDVSTNMLSGTPTYRLTSYTHRGLSTEIVVCRSENSTTCLASPAPLVMKRRFDSAGKLLVTTDAATMETVYHFDGAGNPIRIRDVVNQLTSATYNDFGYRSSVTDTDRGTWHFAYNGLGELIRQCDSRAGGTACTNVTSTTLPASLPAYVTFLGYDKLGRTISRDWSESGRELGSSAVRYSEVSEFENFSSSTYGTLKSQTRLGSSVANAQPLERWQRSFVFDALNRPRESTTQMQLGSGAVTTLQSGVAYDRNFGRVKQQNYPASLADGGAVSTYVYYDDVGNAVREGFAQDYNAGAPQSSAAIRAIKTTDARGLPLSIHLGEVLNGSSTTVDWKETNTFDSSGWLLGRCVNQSGICQPSMVPSTDPLNEAFRYDVYGNLLTHVHGGRWLNGQTTSAGVQSYTYDTLHRLTSYSRSGDGTNVTVAYKYDAIGGLLKKTDYSADSDTAYSYLLGTHKLQSVALQSGGMASFDYDANGNVTQKTEKGLSTAIAYDIGNLPRRMSRNGITSDFFEAPGGRYWQRLVSAGSTRDTLMLEKTYERELVGGAVTMERYYVAGQLLTIKPSTPRKLSYLHQDRLGSNVAISEKALTATGRLDGTAPELVEVRGFDAFGKALDGQWGSTNNGLLNVFDFGSVFHVGKRNQRGFTGHEHLDEFALIHMNGRAYDFNLGRFYGVDPIIQFPGNSQSLNPYGYLMNNPLAGTDPTGYCIKHSGSKICDHAATLANDARRTLAAGGSVAFKGFSKEERAQIRNWAAKSGWTLANGATTTAFSPAGESRIQSSVEIQKIGDTPNAETSGFQGGFVNEEVRWSSQKFVETLNDKLAGKKLIRKILFSGVVLYSYDNYYEVKNLEIGGQIKIQLDYEGFHPVGTNEVYVKRVNVYEKAAGVLAHEFSHFYEGADEPDARIVEEQFAIDMGYDETGPGYRTLYGQVNVEAIRLDVNKNQHYTKQQNVQWSVSNKRRIDFWTGLEF